MNYERLKRRMLYIIYMRLEYNRVPGMSSSFSAKVCSQILKIQHDNGYSGDVAEIGCFEGRFLIALALAMSRGDQAIGIDTFSWPDDAVRSRVERRLDRLRLTPDVKLLSADSKSLIREAVLQHCGKDRKIRFFHIDGEHTAEALSSDFELAMSCMTDSGVICVDDMLSPAYPELVGEFINLISQTKEWSVFCIIDRENIAASSKFLICRSEYFFSYADSLASSLHRFVWPMGAVFSQHKSLVLSPNPVLYRFHKGGRVTRIRYKGSVL